MTGRQLHAEMVFLMDDRIREWVRNGLVETGMICGWPDEAAWTAYGNDRGLIVAYRFGIEWRTA